MPKPTTMNDYEIGSYVKKVMPTSESKLQRICQGIKQEYINIDLIKSKPDSQTKEQKRLSEQEFIQQVEVYKEFTTRPDNIKRTRYTHYQRLVQKNAGQVIAAIPKITEEQIRKKTVPVPVFIRAF